MLLSRRSKENPFVDENRGPQKAKKERSSASANIDIPIRKSGDIENLCESVKVLKVASPVACRYNKPPDKMDTAKAVM